MLTNDAVLRTPRLELRPLAVEDAPALFNAYASDPRVAKYMDWRPPQHAAEVSEHTAVVVAAAAAGKCAAWVIRKVDETGPCGKIELRLGADGGEVGYMLAASHWGQGIMTEALNAVLEFARKRLSLRRVFGTCDPENSASARVFEKCGFKYAGRRKAALVRPNISDEPRDSECYEIAW